MEGTLRDGVVHVGGNARQQFHDARGYGRPLGGNEIELAPVEAAHLLFRGSLTAVETDGTHEGDRLGFRQFLDYASREVGDRFELRFLTYVDLRNRGFYCSPVREGWGTERSDEGSNKTDFVVYERGTGPADGNIAYRIRVVGERERIAASELGAVVLSIVDEESEVTYLETERPSIDGATETELPTDVPARLLTDRVLAWEYPETLYEQSFFGRPLGERDELLQLSLVEAAYLTARGVLDIDQLELEGSQTQTGDTGYDAVVERGRQVEGERFDRRLRTYTELRERRVVPKTGFKFGADFRTYADVTSVDELSHSELLVRVLPEDHTFHPRDLALDVRLAGGVRKRMLFARDDGNGIDWLAVGRLTP